MQIRRLTDKHIIIYEITKITEIRRKFIKNILHRRDVRVLTDTWLASAPMFNVRIYLHASTSIQAYYALYSESLSTTVRIRLSVLRASRCRGGVSSGIVFLTFSILLRARVTRPKIKNEFNVTRTMSTI